MRLQPFPAAVLMAVLTTAHLAQAQPVPEPRNVVQLNASAYREAVQDWLTVVLVTRQQAADAATVQTQLKAVLEKALKHAMLQTKPGALEVSTGGFSVQPRYGREGQILGWQGSAELLLQGRDLARLSTLSGQVPGMSVAQMSFSLSRDASRQLEGEIRQEAIANFRGSAQDVARSFGFERYELREVSVQVGGGEVPMFRQRAMLADAGAALSAAPVPVEPGKSLVQVTVSGSVQLMK